VAPESLTKEENIEFLKKAKSVLWRSMKHIVTQNGGHDFRPEYRRYQVHLVALIRTHSSTIIALTATGTTESAADIQRKSSKEEADYSNLSFQPD